MFKSQYNQDKYCYETYLNQLPTPGVFVEVGASNGIKHSNTYFYEKSLNWSGLCIEPRENVYDDLLKNRDCFCEQIGIAPEYEEDVDFLEITGWGEGLSGIVRNYNPQHKHIVDNHIEKHELNEGMKHIKIKTCPLQVLLDKYVIKHINFITVDTEGGELNILKTIDWDKTTIDVLSVENNYNSNTYFRDYLEGKGFMFSKKLEIDEVYVHKTFIQKQHINVLFTSPWATPTEMLKEYSVMLPDGKTWRNLRGTDNPDEADVCVLIEGASNPNIYSMDPNKLICFPREPYSLKPVKQYDAYNLPHAYSYDTIYHCVPQFNFLKMGINELLSLQYPFKYSNASCIVSMRTHTNGSRARLSFLDMVMKKYPDCMQVFGKGTNEIDSKISGLLPFKYSLCMENSQQNNYFTEKFTDAIVCWSIPIYWGCPNISEYFPNDSYHYIDITQPDAPEQLIKIISQPITRDNIIALIHARNLIFSEYNIWSTVRMLTK